MFLPLRVAPVAGGEDVRFRTTDGLLLAGTYLRARTPTRAGVVVFCHEYLSDRWSFQPYADQLRDQGFDLFSFDFRNHGESPNDPVYKPLQWVTDHEVYDLQAALAYLRTRPDADPAGRRPAWRGAEVAAPALCGGGLATPASGASSPTERSRPGGRCCPTSSAGPRSTSATRCSGRRCRSSSSSSSAGPAGSRPRCKLQLPLRQRFEQAAVSTSPLAPGWRSTAARTPTSASTSPGRALRASRRAQGTLDRRRGQAQPLPREGPDGLPRPGLVIRPPVRPEGPAGNPARRVTRPVRPGGSTTGTLVPVRADLGVAGRGLSLPR